MLIHYTFQIFDFYLQRECFVDHVIGEDLVSKSSGKRTQTDEKTGRDGKRKRVEGSRKCYKRERCNGESLTWRNAGWIDAQR